MCQVRIPIVKNDSNHPLFRKQTKTYRPESGKCLKYLVLRTSWFQRKNVTLNNICSGNNTVAHNTNHIPVTASTSEHIGEADFGMRTIDREI